MALLNSNPKKRVKNLWGLKVHYKNVGYFILRVLYNEIQKEMRVRSNTF